VPHATKYKKREKNRANVLQDLHALVMPALYSNEYTVLNLSPFFLCCCFPFAGGTERQGQLSRIAAAAGSGGTGGIFDWLLFFSSCIGDNKYKVHLNPI
jgi:hypothetical protein